MPSSETVDPKTAAKLEKIPDVFVKEVLAEPTFDVRLTKRTVSHSILFCLLLLFIINLMTRLRLRQTEMIRNCRDAPDYQSS